MKKLPFILPIVLAGCTAPHASDKPIGMPNPASAYCTDRGGKLEIRKGPDGDTGYCHLPDGRVIEEWELFRSQQENPAT